MKKAKWIFYKHTNDYEAIQRVALELRNNRAAINTTDRIEMRKRLEDLQIYKSRIKEGRKVPLDSMNHRINTLKYFMFGYEALVGKEKKLMFSPLGNLYFKNFDDPKALEKIFATMLYAIQFPHPANNQNEKFKIYPFRLIFKLLLDDRLGSKLYDFEVITKLVFIENINNQSYEQLVEKILESRTWSIEKKKQILQKEENTLVTACYEWEYYMKKLLNKAGIFNTEDGEVICKLYHPQKPSSKSNPTGRKSSTGSISLNDNLKPLISSLLASEDGYDNMPILMGQEVMLTEDYVKEVYSYYPEELLDSLGLLEEEKFETELLNLPKLINDYSMNPNNETSDLFEDVLCDAFNLFHNVEARKLSGAGRTDIECIHLEMLPNKDEKFAVDAKSTKTKLMQLSAGRLAGHRELIGAKYTLVITPRYAPAVLNDIKNQGVYIIKASTFSEYIYNHLNLNIRDIDYDDIYELIQQSGGDDISELLSKRTVEKFAMLT